MWTPLVSKISAKLGLRESKLTKTNIGSLWQLCEQEASLLDNEDCACSLFDNEVRKLYKLFTHQHTETNKQVFSPMLK